MKSLTSLALILSVIFFLGCSKKNDPFNFQACQLSKIEYTGSIVQTWDYIYDGNGRKIKRIITSGGNTDNTNYDYDGNNRLIKITNNDNSTEELVYTSSHISKVIYKTSSGNLSKTEDYSWSNNILTISGTNANSSDTYTDVFTFSGQDITKEVYSYYLGGTIWFKDEFLYDQFDTGYNPEYLMDYPLPASLHNYNRVSITDTDYSSGSPVSSGFLYNYTVTLNNSNAVAYRERTRSDNNELLVRTYSYSKCK